MLISKLLGAYVLAAHGHPKATGDTDLWVRPTIDNANKVWRALAAFGTPVSKLKVEDFTTPDIVFQIGAAPRQTDLLTSLFGLTFDDAWTNRTTVTIEGLVLAILGREDLVRNKRGSGRPKDLADIAALESDR